MFKGVFMSELGVWEIVKNNWAYTALILNLLWLSLIFVLNKKRTLPDSKGVIYLSELREAKRVYRFIFFMFLMCSIGFFAGSGPMRNKENQFWELLSEGESLFATATLYFLGNVSLFLALISSVKEDGLDEFLDDKSCSETEDADVSVNASNEN